MFDHVTIRVHDPRESVRFYRLVLAALELKPTFDGPSLVEWNDFSIAPASAERPPTRGLHIAFAAASPAGVDAFWDAGRGAGFRDDGPPGPRPQYGHDYYGGFLLDPDGNSAEAVHHDEVDLDTNLDHVWLRVADLDASRRFYESVAEHAGLRFQPREGRAQFAGTGGTLSVLEGEPSENVHLAFPADAASVEAFHRSSTAAGYRDNGPPGERPEYHPGYYGAYVLDPDGNNVELVDHRREWSVRVS